MAHTTWKLGALGGALGGGGAASYQWALRNPGHDTPAALVAMLATWLAWAMFAIGALIVVLAAAEQARAPRKWVLIASVAVAFLATLYACGGSWPFWRA